MNAVSKIFVVLIFTTSIILMCCVSLVYVAHTNWQEKAKQLEEDKKGLQARLDELQAEKNAMEIALQEVITADQTKIANLETDCDLKTTQNEQLQQEVADLNATLNESFAAVTASGDTLKNYREKNADLLAELNKARDDRTATFSDVVVLTDELHELELDYDALVEREKGLQQQLADARTVLNLHDLQPNPALYAGVAPRVEGVVLAVRPTGLIEISIGEDDGLQPGHNLEVYRMNDEDGVYLGRVQVSHIEPDKAVCTILPQFRKGMMQRGDSVASKLQ